MAKAAGDHGNRWSGWTRARLIEEIRLLQRHLDTRLQGEGESDGEAVLNTVRVPEPFQAPFLAAQGYVKRYFDSLVRDPQKASISIAGERYILLRAASMSVEFVDLVTSLYKDRAVDEARGVANNLLFDMAHAIGKADARAFQEKMGVEDPIARLSAGPVHFAFSGWAYVDIHPESRPTPDEDFYLSYDHPYSFESHAWLSKGRRSEEPACVMNAGYSSGWCEESFGLPLVAAEIECQACGADRCRFVMAPPARIEEHLERLGYRGGHRKSGPGGQSHSVAIPEFFQRRRLEDELVQANTRLEERVAERTAKLTEATGRLRLLATAVDNAAEGIVTFTANLKGGLVFRTVNRGFTTITGVGERDAEGRELDILNIASEDQTQLDRLAKCVLKGRAFEAEVAAVRPDGEAYTLELHIMPAGEAGQEAVHWIGLFRDTTRRRRHLAQLRRQATYDALTALPNRVSLLNRLEEEVATVMATGQPMALMLMDLDGFKDINDTFGHHAGDQLLEQVGPRLREGIRRSDMVARLGGDEFAVLQPGIGSNSVAVRQARSLIAALQKPFEVDGQELSVGASIGVVICPAHGKDATTLLRHADVAMYVAKHRHTEVEIYREEDDTHSPERLALIGELRTGLERDELVIHYQPQVNIQSGRTQNVEALIRWNHPTRGQLAPDEFIPLIELGNLVDRLTDWLLERAVSDCVVWLRDGHDIGLSINIAPRSIRDPHFASRVAKVLTRHQVDPRRLTLEITESGLFVDPQRSLPLFQELRAMGLRLAIDDFGTGYSSFAHLRTLPVDEIKIDRSFVMGMETDEQDAAIVASTITLGRSAGREVVAEGVESAPVLARLRELECDLAQGFELARPMPLEELRTWLEARRL